MKISICSPPINFLIVFFLELSHLLNFHLLIEQTLPSRPLLHIPIVWKAVYTINITWFTRNHVAKQADINTRRQQTQTNTYSNFITYLFSICSGKVITWRGLKVGSLTNFKPTFSNSLSITIGCRCCRFCEVLLLGPWSPFINSAAISKKSV